METSDFLLIIIIEFTCDFCVWALEGKVCKDRAVSCESYTLSIHFERFGNITKPEGFTVTALRLFRK